MNFIALEQWAAWRRSFLNIRKPVSRGWRLVLGALPVLGLLLLWALLTAGAAEERVISPLILPSPGEVIGSFSTLWFDAELSRSILASTGRVAGGFVVALLIAFPLGLLMGAFGRVKALFDPLVRLLQ